MDTRKENAMSAGGKVPSREYRDRVVRETLADPAVQAEIEDFRRESATRRANDAREGETMSYMRWPVYVWSDGVSVHLWARRGVEDEGVRPIEEWCLDPEDGDFAGGFSMPVKLFDQLALVRVAQMTRDGLIKRTVRALRARKSPFSGNASAYAFFEAIGRDPHGEFKKLIDSTKRAGVSG